jgi:WD40 repeat protein
LVSSDRIFSASDDRTIIEWLLKDRDVSRVYARLSASGLGHLGPVNSLSICGAVMFSAGSDNTVRRWNTETGKHEDVYFGFSKPATAVICQNGSVFAGSEDFSVLMFKPNIREQVISTTPSRMVSMSMTSKNRKIVKSLKSSGSSGSAIQLQIIVIIAGSSGLLALAGFVVWHKKQSAKDHKSPIEVAVSSETTYITTD